MLRLEKRSNIELGYFNRGRTDLILMFILACLSSLYDKKLETLIFSGALVKMVISHYEYYLLEACNTNFESKGIIQHKEQSNSITKEKSYIISVIGLLRTNTKSRKIALLMACFKLVKKHGCKTRNVLHFEYYTRIHCK